MSDTVIVIPTKRPPPIKTLMSYPTNRSVLIVSDPDVFDQHATFWAGDKTVMVVLGVKGSIPQALEVYRQAAKYGYQYFFRLDDDIQPKYFVSVDNTFPTLDEAIDLARECITVTRTSLAGFANTSRRDWLGQPGVYKRGAGLIHGGSQIGLATEQPEQFLDPALPAYDDVYRSASHRKRDGAVGVVSWIGLDKRESLRDTTVHKSEEVVNESIRIILGAFPEMVTCRGTRTLDGGKQVIPNWRMRGRAK
jgi:hypothetical protein